MSHESCTCIAKLENLRKVLEAEGYDQEEATVIALYILEDLLVVGMFSSSFNLKVILRDGQRVTTKVCSDHIEEFLVVGAPAIQL